MVEPSLPPVIHIWPPGCLPATELGEKTGAGGERKVTAETGATQVYSRCPVSWFPEGRSGEPLVVRYGVPPALVRHSVVPLSPATDQDPGPGAAVVGAGEGGVAKLGADTKTREQKS